MKQFYGIIDITTDFVSTLLCNIENGKVNIIAESTCSCNGIRKGEIIDSNAVLSSIRTSVEEVESKANAVIHTAYVYIRSMHVNFVNQIIWTKISGENKKVDENDIMKLRKKAEIFDLSDEWEIIEKTDELYCVDDKFEITNPLGMMGDRLGLVIYEIAGLKRFINFVKECFKKLNMNIDGYIPEPLLLKNKVSHVENSRGVNLLINMDTNTTDIMLIKEGKIVFLNSLHAGSYNITGDVSLGLEIPYNQAEKIVENCNTAKMSILDEDNDIPIKSTYKNNDRTILKSQIVEIIEARINEIFILGMDMILENSNFKKNDISKVILTGRHFYELKGYKEIAVDIFELPVKIIPLGNPKNPEYEICLNTAEFLSDSTQKIRSTSEIEIFSKKRPKRNDGIIERVVRAFDRFFS